MKLWKYLFIIPWDTASTFLYSWVSEQLNGTKASVLLHISDIVIILYLIINALQQQAMLSMFRWMHVAQRGCWITAAVQAGWATDGNQMAEVGRHFWRSRVSRLPRAISSSVLSISKDGDCNCSEQPASMSNHSHSKKSFSYVQMVFSVFQFVPRQWIAMSEVSECIRCRKGEDR